MSDSGQGLSTAIRLSEGLFFVQASGRGRFGDLTFRAYALRLGGVEFRVSGSAFNKLRFQIELDIENLAYRFFSEVLQL